MKTTFRIYTFLFFLQICIGLCGQGGIWVWLRGDSTFGSTGSYGTQGVPSATNDPPARYTTCYWQDLNGNFWMYGGSTSRTSANLNDLWRYTPATNIWTWMGGVALGGIMTGNYGTKGVPSMSNFPHARAFGSSTWVDSTGDLWLFGGGGIGASANGTLNDLWKYHIATGEWTWVSGDDPNAGITTARNFGTKGVAAATNFPGDLWEIKSNWVYNNELYLFGGHDFNRDKFNALWKYSVATNLWTWVGGTSNPNDAGNFGTKGVAAVSNVPPARMSFTKWQNGNKLYIFGGQENDNGFSYNDVWQYNIATGLWTWVHGQNFTDDIGVYPLQNCLKDTQYYPRARMENQTIQTSSCNKSCWTYGGARVVGKSEIFSDLWIYFVDSNRWKRVSGDTTINFSGRYNVQGVANVSNAPPNKAGHAIWNDNDYNLYMFGGWGIDSADAQYSGTKNDLWKFIPDSICILDNIAVRLISKPPRTTICRYDSLVITLDASVSQVSITPLLEVKYDTAQKKIIIKPTVDRNYTIIASGSLCNITKDTLNIQVKINKDTAIIYDSFCSNKNYTYHNKTYTKEGNYRDTLKSSIGCDSFIFLRLTTRKVDTTDISGEFCSNDSFLFNNQYCKSGGIYWDTFPKANGCDSLVRLLLTKILLDSTTKTIYICRGDSVRIGMVWRKLEGQYLDTTIKNIKNCDSLIFYNLTYYKNDTSDSFNFFCYTDSFYFNGSYRKSEGVYWDTLKDRHSCDSFIRLYLQKIIPDTFHIRTTVCNGALIPFNGNMLNTDGIYWDTLLNRYGCDSFIRLRLKYNDKDTTYITRTICYDTNYYFNNQYLYQSGIYWDSFINMYDCDSFIVLTLVVVPPDTTALDSSICYGGSMMFNGQIRQSSGIYWDTLSNRKGCDSFIRMRIRITPSVIRDTVRYLGCHQVIVKGTTYTQSSIRRDTVRYFISCDSQILTSLVTIKPSPVVLPAQVIYFCDSIQIRDKMYYHSMYIIDTSKTRDSVRCDSTYQSLTLEMRRTTPMGIAVDPKRMNYHKGDILKLSANRAFHHRWNTEDTSSFIIQKIIRDTTHYTVIGWDTSLCPDTAAIIIVADDSIRAAGPMAFSPNGDGSNDIIYCRGWGIERLVSYKIYNRLGQLLFVSTDINYGWDGYYKGVLQNSDVYFYIYEAISYDGKKISGEGNFLLLK